MKKRLLAVLTAAVVAAGLFAGCGGSDSGSAAAPAAEEKKEEAAPAAEEKKEEAAPAAEEKKEEAPAAPEETAPAGGDVAGKKVAYSLGNTFEERWQGEIAMFQEFFDGIGVDFQYQLAENDNNKQVNQCETFLNQGIDLLIITPADADAAATIVSACKEDGVPVVVYDQPLNSPDVDYLCTFDAVETGELEAKLVFEQVPKGNYVVLYGDPANVNAQNIYKGFWNTIGDAVEAGDINVVLEQWVEAWNPSKALEYMENALTAQGNDIQAVLAPNDGIAGGVVEALTAQGMAGEVPVEGQDADIAACQRVLAGTQTATVYKNLMKLNAATCQLVEAMLRGDADPTAALDPSLATITTFELADGKQIPLISPEQVLVTKENMKEVIVDGGFHTMEEVYANVPKDEWPTD